MDFDFAALSRWPDVEAENLYAADAADRLLLDEAADALGAAAPGGLAVIGDGYGALTLGAAARHGVRGIRTHQDPLSGERALAANAERFGLSDAHVSLGLDESLLSGAQVVLLRLPRSLDALDEIAEAIARWARPDVRVFAGGMVKHMTTAMNDVLRRHFGRVDVTHARQKARVLIAADPARPRASAWPRTRIDAETGLTIVAHAAAFAGPAVDIGTRFLVAHLDDARPGAERAIDLGCGTGVLAVELARRRGITVLATDQSAAAVASARATAAANGAAELVEVVRDDALGDEPDASADLIVLNPPFHIGATVHPGIALKLFADAGRVLAPGGELRAVWNSHLRYRPALERLVGPTREIARNPTFTVTASVRT
ncbi:methyltransferase [Microbacterium sp.]|uniref:class I SAM-dependent methyltransferase n=1 Tax=Microbacterium sp. TaxID=51671 RepID=UPI001ACD0519|nr:methyltransferase [Microbacterium sp.]MBN9188105.1 methyltransferase [Microbacterium sp.]MBN9192103.1 methyltransferase [Microbacterium sp.]